MEDQTRKLAAASRGTCDGCLYALLCQRGEWLYSRLPCMVEGRCPSHVRAPRRRGDTYCCPVDRRQQRAAEEHYTRRSHDDLPSD